MYVDLKIVTPTKCNENGKKIWYLFFFSCLHCAVELILKKRFLWLGGFLFLGSSIRLHGSSFFSSSKPNLNVLDLNDARLPLQVRRVLSVHNYGTLSMEGTLVTRATTMQLINHVNGRVNISSSFEVLGLSFSHIENNGVVINKVNHAKRPV